jgi:hypothetical protein
VEDVVAVAHTVQDAARRAPGVDVQSKRRIRFARIWIRRVKVGVRKAVQGVETVVAIGYSVDIADTRPGRTPHVRLAKLAAVTGAAWERFALSSAAGIPGARIITHTVVVGVAAIGGDQAHRWFGVADPLGDVARDIPPSDGEASPGV